MATRKIKRPSGSSKEVNALVNVNPQRVKRGDTFEVEVILQNKPSFDFEIIALLYRAGTGFHDENFPSLFKKFFALLGNDREQLYKILTDEEVDLLERPGFLVHFIGTYEAADPEEAVFAADVNLSEVINKRTQTEGNPAEEDNYYVAVFFLKEEVIEQVRTGNESTQFTQILGTGVKAEDRLHYPYSLVVYKDQSVQSGTPVSLTRTSRPDTPDKVLSQEIKNRRINFNEYAQLLDLIVDNGKDWEISGNHFNSQQARQRLPFVGTEQYSVVKFATEAYMLAKANLLDTYLGSYLKEYKGARVLPYYDLILNQLGDMNLIKEVSDSEFLLEREQEVTRTKIKVADSIRKLPMICLIWSYWMEQGMLVQTLNAISLRFQNMRGIRELEPLNRLDLDPLRPLSSLFWGYIQDERNRLTIRMRNNEYLHTYGLTLLGRAVPPTENVDNRSKFLEAFHNLLHSTSVFFKESDDTTRVPDGFPVLNSLREVHLLLTEGDHNAYGNLTWTARQEMMVQQYLLGRPEMREFLGGRVMVPYPERWMDRVDTMRQLQNWGSTSITYYHDLATFGEQILLSIRYGNWSIENNADSAANWATAFRNEIQRYIHSYRTVTGVDLSADAMDVNMMALREDKFIQPALLIQQRLQTEQQHPVGNGTRLYSRVSR